VTNKRLEGTKALWKRARATRLWSWGNNAGCHWPQPLQSWLELNRKGTRGWPLFSYKQRSAVEWINWRCKHLSESARLA